MYIPNILVNLIYYIYICMCVSRSPYQFSLSRVDRLILYLQDADEDQDLPSFLSTWADLQ